MIQKKKRWERTRADVCLPACLRIESHMFCVVSRSRQQQQQCFHQRRRKMRWRRRSCSGAQANMVGGVKGGKKKEKKKDAGLNFYIEDSTHKTFSISTQKIARRRLLCRLLLIFFYNLTFIPISYFCSSVWLSVCGRCCCCLVGSHASISSCTFPISL